LVVGSSLDKETCGAVLTQLCFQYLAKATLYIRYLVSFVIFSFVLSCTYELNLH